MRSIRHVALIFAVLITAANFHAQQQQQSNPTIQQIQEQAARAQAEAQARAQAEQRQAITNAQVAAIMNVNAADVSKTAPRRLTETCLNQIMPRTQDVDAQELPLERWLAQGEVTQIPWKTVVGLPRLRMDQRFEISFNGRIDGKELRGTQASRELVFVAGISDMGGRMLVKPKASRQSYEAKLNKEVQVRFSDCVFMQPGDYVLWIMVYDRNSERHNLLKRHIRIPQFSSDPLPNLNTRLPVAEFPRVDGGNPAAPETSPGAMLLPITTKGPLHVELISILAAPDQWAARSDLVRFDNNEVLAATGLLSQMQLKSGSVSLFTLDLVNRTVPFRQFDLSEFDWGSLAKTFTPVADNQRISLPALQALKQRSDFLRNWVLERLGLPLVPQRARRVMIFVSGTLSFARGSDLTPLRSGCSDDCRVYHLRMRVSSDDVFDDLGKLIQPLHPKTFNIYLPTDFRKALGEIVQDLNNS
jgi:hypothetical protein